MVQVDRNSASFGTQESYKISFKIFNLVVHIATTFSLSLFFFFLYEFSCVKIFVANSIDILKKVHLLGRHQTLSKLEKLSRSLHKLGTLLLYIH